MASLAEDSRSIFTSSQYKMAGDELSKSEFTSILSSIDRKFEIIHTKWTDDKNFEAKFRTQIPRDSDDYNTLCDEWVDLFSQITSTTWVKKISNTGPKIKFRKQYQCWTHPGKVQKELLFDARKCKATIDIKVLTDNPQTRRKNKHIKLGLNVVVKINFIHLHKADTLKSYSFFVHGCEPQPEPPRPMIQPNDKLPRIIADIVEKGRQSTSPKSCMIQQDTLNTPESNLTKNVINLNGTITQLKLECQDQLLSNQLQVQNVEQLNMIQLNQVVPIQGMDTIKLQVQPQLQQLTQVVVSSPQLDMSEPMLMCQPTLMFDPTQVIPVSTHSIPHHFLHVHSNNLQHNQGHY